MIVAKEGQTNVGVCALRQNAESIFTKQKKATRMSAKMNLVWNCALLGVALLSRVRGTAGGVIKGTLYSPCSDTLGARWFSFQTSMTSRNVLHCALL